MPDNENEKEIYVRLILQHHFGIRDFHTGDPRCGTCTDMPFPCAPARLARLLQEEALAS